MKTIQPGHEVLSVFGIPSKIQALAKKDSNKGLIVSLVSAFLIVLIVGMLLSLAQKTFNKTETPVLAATKQQEAVAFQPGQFVTERLEKGYYKGH